jgi:hypothetical protein
MRLSAFHAIWMTRQARPPLTLGADITAPELVRHETGRRT